MEQRATATRATFLAAIRRSPRGAGALTMRPPGSQEMSGVHCADERLRRVQRLRKRRQFQRVQRFGARVHTRHFVILVSPKAPRSRVGEDSLDSAGTRGSASARLGITVTKKVGHAVARNRVKRLVREVFRRCRHHFPEGSDLVFIAKRGCSQVTYAELFTEIREASTAVHAAFRRAARRSEREDA